MTTAHAHVRAIRYSLFAVRSTNRSRGAIASELCLILPLARKPRERSAERRKFHCRPHTPTRVAAGRCFGRGSAHFRGALAFRRSAAALARTLTSRLSFRPCFLGLGRNGRYPSFPVPVQRKHLAPPSSCRREWCPKPPGCGVTKPARRHPADSISGSSPEMPSTSQLRVCNIISDIRQSIISISVTTRSLERGILPTILPTSRVGHFVVDPLPPDRVA